MHIDVGWLNFIIVFCIAVGILIGVLVVLYHQEPRTDVVDDPSILRFDCGTKERAEYFHRQVFIMNVMQDMKEKDERNRKARGVNRPPMNIFGREMAQAQPRIGRKVKPIDVQYIDDVKGSNIDTEA